MVLEPDAPTVAVGPVGGAGGGRVVALTMLVGSEATQTLSALTR